MNIKSFRSSLRYKRFLPVRLIFLGIRGESLILFPENHCYGWLFSRFRDKNKEVTLIKKDMNYFKFLFNLEQLLGKRYQKPRIIAINNSFLYTFNLFIINILLINVIFLWHFGWYWINVQLFLSLYRYKVIISFPAITPEINICCFNTIRCEMRWQILTASISPFTVGDFNIKASNTSSASFLTYSRTKK